MKFVVSDGNGYDSTNKVWTSTAVGTAFTQTVYKTFTIGLNMVNQLFDIKNKFYTAAYTKQTVKLSIKL